jgi:hypothetical protein
MNVEKRMLSALDRSPQAIQGRRKIRAAMHKCWVLRTRAQEQPIRTCSLLLLLTALFDIDHRQGCDAA